MVTVQPAKLFGAALLAPAVLDSFRKCAPFTLAKNPVIFITAVGALLSTFSTVRDLSAHHGAAFSLQITLWLWFTVLFANFAEAIAEGRGKAQASALKKNRTQTIARKLDGAAEKRVVASALKHGDIVVCEAGDLIPSDGEVIEGIASVDESAITGESAPVIRESGGDRSAVTGGTKVISDRIVIRITAEQGKSYLDRMIALVEGAMRQKTPNEIALSILLSSLSLVFLVVVMTLLAFSRYLETSLGQSSAARLDIPVLVALLVCLIPTTIGGLLSAIGISGMNRLLRHNVLAMSGRAIEAAGDVDVLMLDKTGTITIGNRVATQFIPGPGVSVERLADVAQLASLADETPEGRSVVVLAKQEFEIRSRDLREIGARFIPFSAQTKMSGVDIPDPSTGTIRRIRKGSADAILHFILSQDGLYPLSIFTVVDDIANRGGTPLVVAEDNRALGVIVLKDVVKGGIRERFERLRAMGIKTVMVTGDNQLTAAAIAAEAGVDDFLAEAKPEAKLARIREEQAKGHLVAMIGDGTNDAPALAQADVGVSMNTGTQAAREAGNMVDLDSNPTKLLEIVEIGKQLFITRGALTTFSIANDVAKYFAIIPALLGGFYAASGRPGPLSALNIMKLSSPESAILSAVIFNAIIIIALIPLALGGVAYRPRPAAKILSHNLLIYGLGGLIIPFIGIKCIDLLIGLLHIVN
jgi:potassium-transporting ATPase ATP-binding subunit